MLRHRYRERLERSTRTGISRYLMAADSADSMQTALTAMMFNCYAIVYRPEIQPFPTFMPYPLFPGSDAVATHSQGAYPVASVVVTQALLPPWNA